MRLRTASIALAVGLAMPTFAQNDPDAQLPVTAVTLYRSGVGSFERSGTVTGDTSISLSFDADQINDILKSLVVLDLDGGRIGGVSYSSDEPIGRRLEALGLTDPSQLTLGVLLGEFQGARIALTTTDSEIEGRILGVEWYQSREDDQVIQRRRLSVMTSEGLISVEETDIRRVRLLDPSLQADLNELLEALGTQRTAQSRSVEIDLVGQGQREILAAYVQETPIWKTSYRLVLPEKAGEKLHIEGWAIVENTTDHDWEDISLSLVAGQPVGFQMDLAEPLYISRPTLPVPVELAAAPKSFGRGVATRGGGQSPFDGNNEAEADNAQMRALFRSSQRSDELGSVSAGAPIAAPAKARFSEAMSTSTAALASGSEEGEVFFFKLDNPVTVGKRESAMLPIITGDIEGRRVSIFSPSTQGEHPYRGVEVTNSTKLKLMPGPLSVFDGSVFAGDAQIGHVGQGERRMLAYAVDLDVDANRTSSQSHTIRKLRIHDGTIIQTTTVQNEYAVELTNHDQSRDRLVVVETPRYTNWDLKSDAKPYETTDDLYRFEIEIDPGESKKLSVVQEQVQDSRMALTSITLETLLVYQRQGAASQAVIDAFKGYAQRKGTVEGLQRKLGENDAETRRIADDQQRIRNLLQAINRQDALYARYMRQLEEHENSLDELRASRRKLAAELTQAQESLDLYVRTLRVD